MITFTIVSELHNLEVLATFVEGKIRLKNLF